MKKIMVKTGTSPSISKKKLVTRVLQKADMTYIPLKRNQIPNKNDWKLTLTSPEKVCCKPFENFWKEGL